MTDDPLPVRGVIPLVFLGLAIVTSTVYLAWHGGTGGRAVATAHPERETEPFARRRAYLIDYQRIMADFLHRRLSWLRAAIVSMAFGLVLLPVPFIEIDIGDAPAAATGTGPVAAQFDALEPPWPAFDASESVRPEDAELRASRYAAEVAEVARARQAALDAAGERHRAPTARLTWVPSSGWAILTGGLLAVTGLVAVRAKERTA